MADLLIATFPAKKSILAAGTHVGMAATSVLEPIVLLYRFTGEPRYLEFARYIVKSWDEPGGPAILASLRAGKGVNRTANGKAYEMLSNLVGVCELARATGDRKCLEPVEAAWKDIVANRLYLTGSASAGEHFQDDHVLPGQAGRAHRRDLRHDDLDPAQSAAPAADRRGPKYGDELERSFYNHLAAAQHPRRRRLVLLHGAGREKAVRPGHQLLPLQRTPRHGPGGAGRLPSGKLGSRARTCCFVNTLETSRAELELGGEKVAVTQESQFPRAGESTMTLHMDEAGEVRADRQGPEVGEDAAARERLQAHRNQEPGVSAGQARLRGRPPREWKDGDRVRFSFSSPCGWSSAISAIRAQAALKWGPFVLAYDASRNLGLPADRDPGPAERQSPRSPSSRVRSSKFRARVVGRKVDEPRPPSSSRSPTRGPTAGPTVSG